MNLSDSKYRIFLFTLHNSVTYSTNIFFSFDIDILKMKIFLRDIKICIKYIIYIVYTFQDIFAIVRDICVELKIY
jgi:hypothetical protein